MNFYSIQFFLFISITVWCYYTILKKQQWICLLAASVVFYYWAGWENFIFILMTGVTTWSGALLIDKYSRKIKDLRNDSTLDTDAKKQKKKEFTRVKRIALWSTILVNFGVLGYLKYLAVIVRNIANILQYNPEEVKLYQHALGLILPLGISFYMFQSIGYLIDIYYEKYQTEKNFGHYMLFVGFFPQLIQGPINRYDAMREQFFKEHIWNVQNAQRAVYKIVYGIFKKYAISNVLFDIISAIFDNPAKEFSGSTILFGIVLYSAQQYADFSGGIDIVLGIAELFGIQMAENFKQPYFATSLADFWRRWHISLGKWMRDYVFYPFALTKPMKKLGKWANKRLGKHLGRVLPAAIGNILVFFVVGLWHGAEWHYIIWGLYNGFVIAVSDIFAPLFSKMVTVLRINTRAIWYHLFQILRTFIVVNIGWYFDRIERIMVAFTSLKKTVFDFNVAQFGDELEYILKGTPELTLSLAGVACCLVFIVSYYSEKNVDVRGYVQQQGVAVRWSIYLVFIIIILLSFTCAQSKGGFMYANF